MPASKRAVMSFHHILSSRKIAALHGWARELGLCGIIKVGYPGVLLFAGSAEDAAAGPDGSADTVLENVKRIKRLRWQTCALRAVGELPMGLSVSDGPSRRSRAADPLEAFRLALVESDSAPLSSPSIQGGANGSAQRKAADRWRGLVQVESMKEITEILRAADRLAEGSQHGAAVSKQAGRADLATSWTSFYSEAMRSP